MGWAAADAATVERAKVLVAQVRQKTSELQAEVIKLELEIGQVEHTDKRTAMLRGLEDAKSAFTEGYEHTYEIDRHLNR